MNIGNSFKTTLRSHIGNMLAIGSHNRIDQLCVLNPAHPAICQVQDSFYFSGRRQLH